jgi:ABC-type lipoprotein export system ATPase subunit
MFKKFFNRKPAEDFNLEHLGLHNGGNNGKGFIRLNKIVKIFSNAAGDFTVLKGIDAEFKEGEFIAVIGKSGSGKSTLINMITGIDRPTSGEVFIGDVPVHKLSEGKMAEWRGRNLGIVFQFFQLLPMLSLVENIMLPMDFCNMYTPKERKERAMDLLRQVELEDHANKLPTAISGGQQQRVAIARALANDPPIIIADEPTGNLDSRSADTVFAMFEKMIDAGKTILMVTHDSSMAKRASRTVLLADGEIVNEYVAKALPTLTHQQMLLATHNLQPQQFEPGAIIVEQGQLGDKFYIVTKGIAEVTLMRPDQNDVVVSRIEAGQYFGEVELMYGGGRSVARVRAARETAVEAVAFDQNTFNKLMSESQATRSAVAEVVDSRMEENIGVRTKDAS